MVGYNRMLMVEERLEACKDFVVSILAGLVGFEKQRYILVRLTTNRLMT